MPHQIPLSALNIAKARQRQDFNPQALEELRASIELNGLLHAPVIREVDGKFWLVAGESRVRVMQDIWELGGSFKYNNEKISNGIIPCTSLGELSELEAEEAELDENLKRKDLTWQEHAFATQRLHGLRTAQAVASHAEFVAEGELPAGSRPVLPTLADTALELHGRSDGGYLSQVRQEIILAKNLQDPDIAKAPNAREAFKILKQKEDRARNIELAGIVGKTFSAASHRLFQTDCLEYMRSPANHSQFDVILTDPPYGIDADTFNDANGRLTHATHSYSDSQASWLVLMSEWSRLSFLVTKPEAHAYLFCDIDNFHELKRLMIVAGWYVFRTPFCYTKLNSGRVPRPEHGPRRQYELVLYAIKGNKKVTQIYPDVFSATGDTNLGHGAQKPVACFQNLLQRSVIPGDRVLDSFAGTGTIFEACHPFKCEAVGLESDPGSFGIAAKRLANLGKLYAPEDALF